MIRSPQQAAIYGLVVVLGLLIGAVLALSQRMSATGTSTTTVAQVTAAPPIRSASAAPVAPAPTATPAPARTATPVAAPAPTPLTTPPPTAILTPAPPLAASPTRAGAIRLEETGTSVGTIVWNGSVARDGGRLALDVRKATVGGGAVGPCERATHVRAVIDPAANEQIVPYSEINCSGSVSAGTMRLARTAPGTFAGSFTSGGVTLGQFTATVAER